MGKTKKETPILQCSMSATGAHVWRTREDDIKIFGEAVGEYPFCKRCGMVDDRKETK